MPNLVDISGNKYGRLTVLKRSDRIRPACKGNRPFKAFYLCRCDCGVEKEVNRMSLVGGNTKSCGCLRVDLLKAQGSKLAERLPRQYPSPDSVVRNHKVEYDCWHGMRGRCKPEHKSRKHYYDRGISVCQEWDRPGGFHLFFEHVGPRPGPGYSLDRIDNNRGYFPGNVRWADWTTQMKNRRSFGAIEKFSDEDILAEAKKRGIIPLNQLQSD